jgi:hypothetical protein
MKKVDETKGGTLNLGHVSAREACCAQPPGTREASYGHAHGGDRPTLGSYDFKRMWLT